MSLILPDKPNDNSKQTSQLVRISGMGTELAAAIIGMTLLGYLIDRFGGTSPWGVLGGAAVGILGCSFYKPAAAAELSRGGVR
ncbi:MAG: AtpZ/AtpI family protein, partial [Phycisphaerales bacterium]|nr:AtpZ/AtpI family protein [Phycisphaerales bacterium]